MAPQQCLYTQIRSTDDSQRLVEFFSLDARSVLYAVSAALKTEQVRSVGMAFSCGVKKGGRGADTTCSLVTCTS